MRIAGCVNLSAQMEKAEVDACATRFQLSPPLPSRPTILWARTVLPALLFVPRLGPPPLELPQRIQQRLDFSFVRVLLHFSQFQRLEDFLHLIEHPLQRGEDVSDQSNRLGNRHGRGGFEIAPLRTRGSGTFFPVFRFVALLRERRFPCFVSSLFNG